MTKIINFRDVVRKCEDLRDKMAKSNAPRGMHGSKDILNHIDDSPYRHVDDKFIYRVGAMSYANMDYLQQKNREKWKASIARAREISARNKQRTNNEV